MSELDEWEKLALDIDLSKEAFKVACAESSELRIERDQLREWRDSVSNAVKQLPEFSRGSWGGDKEGWGYHFEVIKWMIREIAQLKAQIATLHGRIMNLPDNLQGGLPPQNSFAAYIMGHRDARHAAAELVSAAMGEK